MSAFQLTTLIALVVIGLMCLDGKVENTVDCRPLVVSYGADFLVFGSRVRDDSGGVPYNRGRGY